MSLSFSSPMSFPDIIIIIIGTGIIGTGLSYSFEAGALRSPSDFYRIQEWARRSMNGEVGTLTGGLNQSILNQERKDSYQPRRSLSNSSSRAYISGNNSPSSPTIKKQN